MSYFDDYIADGLCCESCGGYIGGEPGFVRMCAGCAPKPTPKPKAKKQKKPTAHRSDCLARYGEDIFGDGK